MADSDSKAARFCASNPESPYTPHIRKIVAQPQAFWLDGKQLDIEGYVRSVLARSEGRLVVFVVYNRPGRDNGQYSAGGSPTLRLYQQWIDAVATASSGCAPVFVIEPDAIAESFDYDDLERENRNECLRYAIDRLSAIGPAYLDMGHPMWKDAAAMVDFYRGIGAKCLRGFSINVSSFNGDSACKSFAQQLYKATGLPSVVDTSRNGNGYHPDGVWCNPDGRKLGRTPLSYRSGASGAIDANLWIKRPGESDGTCNGGPPAGDFWPMYAAGL